MKSGIWLVGRLDEVELIQIDLMRGSLRFTSQDEIKGIRENGVAGQLGHFSRRLPAEHHAVEMPIRYRP